ncbi:MAG: hypothetical protein ABSC17_00020 [Thermacetogeniaceae bacterium]
MFLITVTNWKHKVSVIIRLLMFLLLIVLITPQFLSLVCGSIASFKSRHWESQPPALRVEHGAETQQQSSQNQGDLFLKILQQYYFGNGKQAPPDSD